MRTHRPTWLLLALCLALSACTAEAHYIPGTKIPQTRTNESIIRRIEEYRLAVEQKDAGKLLLLADPQYWEDSGTPSGTDDYGYGKLKDVLAGRFRKASSIRYSMRYENIRRRGDRAYVDVLIDASYTIPDARGEEVREDMRDQNQIVLRWDPKKEQWMFLAGL